MDLDPQLGYPLLFVTGLVAGTLNVIAGGGSFLTLPILIFLGLPAGIANGTNRVGILLQNVSAVWGFHRYGIFDRRYFLTAGLPAALGSALGTWLALVISDRAFQQILALLMVVISLLSLWTPRRRKGRHPPAKTDGTGADAEDPDAGASDGEAPGDRRWLLLAVGFFLAGIYGGFVQAGVGFLVLAVTTAAGLDLVCGNAVKVLAIMCLTGLSLVLFAWQGRVVWSLGLCLAAGTILGALLGARLTVLKGHRWVRRVVTAMVVVFAVKLWFSA
jgi:hypothetical protein